MKFGPLESSPGIRQNNFLPIGVMVIIMMSALGIILARLAVLTIFRGGELRRRADENRILVRIIPAPRGIIFDYNDEALTRNSPEGRAYPFDINFPHAVGYVGEVSEDEIKNDPSLNQGDIIGKTGMEKQYDKELRGIDGAELIEVDANGNLLGVLEDQLPQAGKDIHTYLDVGLQIAMTESLRGRKGAAVAIDPVGGAVLGLVSSPAYDPNLFSGMTKRISENGYQFSDVGSQSKVNQSSVSRSESDKLKTDKLITENGEPKTDNINNDKLNAILSDTINMPLFNRAISGEYPPGSIFKLVTATAGLTENKINRQTLVEDTGEIRVGAFRFGNWYFDQYGKTEGEIGITRALARSNDIFFYKVGEWLGPDLLANWAVKMGLGKKTGIDLSGEADGLIPDAKWKEKTTGERWFLGNTYHMAIGQGDVQLTPLQAVMMASAVVTGKRCQPRIALLTTNNPPGRASGRRQQLITNNCEDIGVSEVNRNLILEGMVGACSPGGTAFPFFPWNEGKTDFPAVACKTGTAQHGGKQAKPHAWIAVTGPIAKKDGIYKLDLESPKRIVLVVMLEDAGEGSYEAGPVAKNILEKWFKAL
jgi:penicillin-binding protein 2